jgi:ubiquinone/menaquinone biosynthesis C-methylase UbiE
MADLTPAPIFEVFTGFMASKHLFIANEVGLFEQLAAEPATLDELAVRTQIPRRTLRIVTDAMVALGLIERDGDHYGNGPVAASFLSGNGRADLRPLIRMANQLFYSRWTKFEQAVRTDQRVLGELRFTSHEQEIFSKGVEAATAGDAHGVAAGYDFAPHQRLLDLGGGTGSFLTAVLNRHPHLQATLFELPAAAAVARERLKAEPLAGQVEIATGDFFTDPIPNGHDAVILAHVIHCFSPERNLELLGRLRQHVSHGARALLVDWWTDPTHTKPRFTALMAGEFLLDVGGDVYSADQASKWLQQTDWRMLEHKQLAGPTSLIVAEAT